MSELFIPKNPTEVAQEFQRTMSVESPETALMIGKQAAAMLLAYNNVYDSKHVIIHAYSGYSVNRGFTRQDQMFQYEYDEVFVKGFFGGIRLVERADNPYLHTFAAELHDVEVMRPVLEQKELSHPQASIMFPVLDVESVMVAA